MTQPTRPELAGTFAMVASTHRLASEAGMAVLETGGNAFDAAVAAGFVLQVVEPHLNGPGGELVALLATGADPTPRVLCGQGVAPAGATVAHYRDLGFSLVPGSGLLAATVPGVWDAWLLLLRDHGTMHLRDVLGYALGHARAGFPLVARVPATIAAVAGLFTGHWTTSAAQWIPGGRIPAAGTRFTNPALADTWERLLGEAEAAGPDRDSQIEAARRAWSEGFVAAEVDAFCRRAWRDESGRDHAGVLTGADLAAWSASYEPALTVEGSREIQPGWTLAKAGGWTQGPVLAQALVLLAGFSDRLSYRDGAPTGETVHLATECTKLALADREAWLGDSPTVDVAALLGAAYLDDRRTLVGEGASFDLRPGRPTGALPLLAAHILAGPSTAEATGALGEPTVRPDGSVRGDTVHVDVVDRWGNMISATPSGGWLQSSPTIPALGFPLGTRAQMFWLDEGLPNSLTPGKRPRTTLSPSLALRHGEPALAFGTPGGDQQDQWQLCFWLAHVHAGFGLQAAIDAPAWHSGAVPESFAPRAWHPGQLVVESRLPPGAVTELASRGHTVVDAGPFSLGRLSAVARDPDTGALAAAANARGAPGYAVGR